MNEIQDKAWLALEQDWQKQRRAELREKNQNVTAGLFAIGFMLLMAACAIAAAAAQAGIF